MTLSLRQRKRLPKLRDIAQIWHVLRLVVPMDEEPQHGWRESYRGVINYRIKSSTNEKEWFVDTYAASYYVVTVSNRFPEPCRTIPSLVGYLCRSVGVRPRLRSAAD